MAAAAAPAGARAGRRDPADPRGAAGDPAPGPAHRRPAADRRGARPADPRRRRPGGRPAVRAAVPGRAPRCRYGVPAAGLRARRRDGLRRPGQPRGDVPAARRAGRRTGARGRLPAVPGAPVPGRGAGLLGGLPVGGRARRRARRGPRAAGARRRLGRRVPLRGDRDPGRRGRPAVPVPAAGLPDGDDGRAEREPAAVRGRLLPDPGVHRRRRAQLPARPGGPP